MSERVEAIRRVHNHMWADGHPSPCSTCDLLAHIAALTAKYDDEYAAHQRTIVTGRAEIERLTAENSRLRNERDSFRELACSLEARVAALEEENKALRINWQNEYADWAEAAKRAEQAEARVAALEAALAEMGNAMEAGAYDAAWTIRNAAFARPTPTPQGEQG